LSPEIEWTLIDCALVIEFTPQRSGDIAFACGMNMLHATIVVQ
jgi:plastocyanin domain-containing protein